jgi:hypothetical protein
MKFINSKQLSAYITELYSKIEKITRYDSIYKPFSRNILFEERKEKYRAAVTYVYSRSDGYHCDDIDERGRILSYATQNLFDICYYVLEISLTSICWDYSIMKNNGVSSRPIAFDKKIEYMRIIGEEYAERCKENIEKILETAPYTEDELLQL